MFTEIRDWCRIMPAGATLKNCYRPRKGDSDRDDERCVPQSFTFMAREGWEFAADATSGHNIM